MIGCHNSFAAWSCGRGIDLICIYNRLCCTAVSSLPGIFIRSVQFFEMVQPILRHWRALSILLGSLVASILFAIGHHLYYHNLAGTPVSTANALAIGGWEGVSSQKLNTAVGTTFAALFRTSLSVAVTTAFAQLVWQALKAKGTKLNIVDSLSGVLQNPLSFLNWEAWKGSMLLFGLAIAIW